MKIYLASSWRNPHQPTVLADLRAAGHEVYDFKNPAPGNTGFGWSQTLDRPIVTAADLAEALKHPCAIAGFTHDYAAMQWAEACVLVLPCGNSAHLEAGWFTGRGKPCAVYVPGELREPELMYRLALDPEGDRTPLFWQLSDLLAHLERRSAEFTEAIRMGGVLLRGILGGVLGIDPGEPRTAADAAEPAKGGQ